MSKQHNIVEKEFDYAVWIPEVTPKGQLVSIDVQARSGVHVMHAESPDQSELYFEVSAYPAMMEHPILVEQQHGFLRQNAPDGTLTEAVKKNVGNYAGTIFEFSGWLQGKWKERRFVFIDGSARTFRVVYDPTSTLNEQVFSTLALLKNERG